MMIPRRPLLALASLAVLAAGCPKQSEGSSLPPAGLAGAPGTQNSGPSVHGAPAAAPAGAPAPASQPGASGQHPWAASPPAGHASPGLDGVVVPGTPAQAELEGTVVEATNAKEYTYVRVKRDDGTEDWAAIMQTTLQPGQRVKISKEIWMSDFNSPTLGRTFDKILFGRLLP